MRYETTPCPGCCEMRYLAAPMHMACYIKLGLAEYERLNPPPWYARFWSRITKRAAVEDTDGR